MSKLFPEYPPHRFRALVESIVSKCLKSETRDVFYNTSVDLDSVGEYCSSLGLTRRKLSDVTAIDVQCDINYRLLLELDSFIAADKLSYEYFFCVVQKLNSEQHFRDARHLHSELVNIRAEKKKLGKSVARKPSAMHDFLERKVPSMPNASVSSDNSISRDAGVTPPTDTTSSLSCEPPSQNKCIKVTETCSCSCSNTKMNENEYLLIKTRLSTYGEICSEKQTQIKKLDEKLQKSNATVESLELKITHLKRQLNEKTNGLIGCKAELKTVKGSGLYQRNRRKEIEWEEKNANLTSATLKVKNARLVQLRQQISGLQVQVNNYKIANQVHRDEKKVLKEKVKSLRDQCVKLEAELLVLTEGSGLEMRQGYHFTEPVEKCVMELMGECEVSSKNVEKVI